MWGPNVVGLMMLFGGTNHNSTLGATQTVVLETLDFAPLLPRVLVLVRVLRTGLEQVGDHARYQPYHTRYYPYEVLPL